MVCTGAFGMGIDQPDINVMVQVGCPSLEQLVQNLDTLKIPSQVEGLHGGMAAQE